MHMQPVRKRSAMAFWVLFSCAVITASARPLELLTSDETRKLISKWNLDHAFGKVSPCLHFNPVDICKIALLIFLCQYNATRRSTQTAITALSCNTQLRKILTQNFRM